MRHKKLEAELDKWLAEIDKRREDSLNRNVEFWLPKIAKVEKRLKHAPDKFAYELRQLNRMRELLLKQKFLGDGFQRMLQIYSVMV